MKRLANLGLVVLVVAACGGGSATPSLPPLLTPMPPATSPLATVTLAATSATSSGPGSTQADQYTAIASKGNAKVDQCTTDMDAAGSDLAKAKVAATECVDAYNQFGADLGAIQWGSVQPQVDDVIKAMGKVQVIFSGMAKAPDVTSFIVASDQLTTAEGDLLGVVNVLRSALGLPPSP